MQSKKKYTQGFKAAADAFFLKGMVNMVNPEFQKTSNTKLNFLEFRIDLITRNTFNKKEKSSV